MAIERTLVLLKPDCVDRGLAGEVLARFERKGLRFAALRMVLLDRETATRHYSAHIGKPFFDSLIRYITSGPIVAAVVEGESAIAVVRRLCGPTDGALAASGTIRGDFSLSVSCNLVHASDSPESAAREIPVFFKPEDFVQVVHGKWSVCRE